jgi:hypothetical protein
MPETVQEFAARVVPHLREHFPLVATSDQLHALTEEACFEVPAAYMLWRRTHTAEDRAALGGELADVLITTHVAAIYIGCTPAAADPRPAFTTANWQDHAMFVGMAAAQAVAAHQRWAGKKRRGGRIEDVAEGLGLTVAAVEDAACAFDIDLDAAWRAKAPVIMTRGWKDKACA